MYFSQRANQLFTDADITTKNKLLRFLPANFTLYGKVLSYRLNNTYEAIATLNKNSPEGLQSQFWCNKLTNLLTEQAIELQHDTAFAELVDVLGLRGDLIPI